MKRTELVKQTIRKMNQLPDDKLNEVADFTEFLLNRIEENDLQNGIQKLASKSKSYNFLKHEDENIYRVSDVKEKYK